MVSSGATARCNELPVVASADRGNRWQPLASAGVTPRRLPAMATLTVHPDRLLPAEPGVRDIARRLYAAVRDLPIISPHGHVDPRMLLDDTPFADPTSLLVQPDHYVTRLLHAGGVRLDRLGVGGGAAARGAGPRGVAAAVRATGTCFRGTPGAVLVRQRAGRDLRGDRAAGRGQRRRALRPDRRAAGRARATGRARCCGASASRCWPPPTTRPTTWPRTPRWPPTRRITTRVAPTFRPDRYLEPAGPAGPTRSSGSARWRTPTSATTPATSRRWRSAAGTSSRTARCPPTTATPTRCAAPLERGRGASGSTARRWPGRSSEAEATAFRRHMMLEMARMSCDDGLVMTLHPGVRRNHHPATFDRYGADTGARHPGRRSSSPTRCGRCSSATAPTRTSTWCCSPWTPTCSPRDRAAGRLLPVGVRRRAVVVPRQPGRDPPLPGGGHRDRRVQPDVRVHRRHPRVLLDPGPARHVPPPRRRLPRRAGRRAPARRGRGRSTPSPTWSPTSRAKVFKL